MLIIFKSKDVLSTYILIDMDRWIRLNICEKFAAIFYLEKGVELPYGSELISNFEFFTNPKIKELLPKIRSLEQTNQSEPRKKEFLEYIRKELESI